MKNLNIIQLTLAVVICLAGIVLLFIALYAPPKGEIHTSILVAYGESLTFVGSLLGIDYHYRYKH